MYHNCMLIECSANIANVRDSYFWEYVPVSINKILRILGVESDSTSHAEKAISSLGGFIGIFLTTWISQHFAGTQGAALMIASTGASAVLLFAVPHGALSQPWPLLGGHVVSALIRGYQTR